MDCCEQFKKYVTHQVGNNQQMFYTSPAFVGSSQARTQVGKLLTSALQETNLTDETLNKLFMDAVDACKRDE